MARHYRTIRRNNRKRLISRTSKGSISTGQVRQQQQIDAPNFNEQILESLIALNKEYPKLYHTIALFNIVDTDGNGEINVVEFSQLMSYLGFTYSPDIIIQLFNLANTDKNSTPGVSLKEFLVFYKHVMMFKEMDSNKNGTVDQKEFSTKFEDTKFQSCDSNGDESLDIVEFIRCMLTDRI